MRQMHIGSTRQVFTAIITAVCLLFVATLFVGCEGQTSDKQASASSPVANAAVGDSITFGTYGGQEISWRVLAIEDDRALVITQDVIDLRAYNEEYEDVIWETCTLRAWLNNDFINTAFSASEQGHLVQVTNKNPNNPVYGTKGGADTTDTVFLLSIDEANTYFKNDSDRIAKLNMSKNQMEDAAHRMDENPFNGNQYTYDEALKVVHGLNGEDYWWWLRSPGDVAYAAANVYIVGGIGTDGGSVYSGSHGVRPALWLNR